jgi:hypothetical protein
LWKRALKEYYTAIKRNELLLYTTWMELMGIILNEKMSNYGDEEQINNCKGYGGHREGLVWL